MALSLSLSISLSLAQAWLHWPQLWLDSGDLVLYTSFHKHVIGLHSPCSIDNDAEGLAVSVQESLKFAMGTASISTANGPEFWDTLLGPKGGQYPEYVSPDVWFGEYVSKLEHESMATPMEQENHSANSRSQASPGAPHRKTLTYNVLVRLLPTRIDTVIA